MAYGEVPTRGFGGLDLASSPDEATGAIDMLNCDLDRRGAVRQRDGFDNFSSVALVRRGTVVAPFYTQGGTRQLFVGFDADGASSTNAVVLNTSGTLAATLAVSIDVSITDAARFGTPAAEYLYYARSPNVTIRRWDGATDAGVASPEPAGRWLAVQRADNRLVNAGFIAPATALSRVKFSNVGAPETWTATEYVDLDPGDGEGITGLASYRELLFAFKESRFYVFYGNSVSATGTTVFNYRPVDAGAGLVAPGAYAAGRDGLYFLSRRGVYRTTGGVPELVSGPVDPIFRGGASSFFLGGILNHAQISRCRMHFHDERVFLAYPSGAATANDRLLVFDPRHNHWSLWDIAANDLASFRIGDTAELVFTYASGANHVGRHSSSYSNDDGAAITSRWRSGFYDLGRSNEKTLRETELWGTGTVGVALSRDFGALDSAANVTLGTSPAVARGVHQVSKKGTLYSFQLSSVSGGAWTVHRLSHNLQGDRPVGMRS